MKVHRNLVWIRARPELMDRLVADPKLSVFIAVRLTPELAAIFAPARATVVARLEKLGLAPRETGGAA